MFEGAEEKLVLHFELMKYIDGELSGAHFSVLYFKTHHLW